MTIYFSLLVCLVGLVVYAISTNARAVELGRLMFMIGLLVFLLTWPRVVAVLGR